MTKLKKFFSIQNSLDAIGHLDVHWLIGTLTSVLLFGIIGIGVYINPASGLSLVLGMMLGLLSTALFVCINSRREKERKTVMDILSDNGYDDIQAMLKSLQQHTSAIGAVGLKTKAPKNP